MTGYDMGSNLLRFNEALLKKVKLMAIKNSSKRMIKAYN